MRKRVMLIPLLIIIHVLATDGRLITTPVNQWIYRGHINITMTCSSTLGSSSITWFHTPVGESVNITIASGSQVYPNFTHLYWIDQGTINHSDLVMRTANESRVGTYTCADNEMLGRAQLIMGNNIIPTHNASGIILIIGDVIRYSIKVSYFGNPVFYPIIYVGTYPEYMANITSSQLENLNSLITATATYYHTASCLSYRINQCGMGYGQPVGNLLPGSATNAPNAATGIGLSSVRVSCVPSITGAVSGAVLYSGAILTCQLNAKLPVNYSWTELTNDTSNIGPQLTVGRGGSYKCTASYNISGLWQSVSASVYNLTVENLSITAKPLYGPIAGGTNVTLTLENWSAQIANISAVYLGGFVKITALRTGGVGNNVLMTTPNATAALIGKPLTITIEFRPGPYNISTNLSFTYKGNPEITGISPSTFVFTGGQTMIVNGIQLPSQQTSNPFIQVTVVVERGIERTATSERSFGVEIKLQIK